MSDNMKVIVKINTHVNEVEVMVPTSRAAATITAMVTSEEVLRSETHVSITGPALVCKSLNVRMLTVAREQRSAPINANHGDIGHHDDNLATTITEVLQFLCFRLHLLE